MITETLQKPLISIVMPAYNAISYIEKAIDSVKSQTYENWELLIIDDKSTDGTSDYLDTIHDDRIHVFHNDINRGTSYSRNKAIHEAKADWIAFLDGDDMWAPTKLEKQVALLEENKEAQFIFTGSAFVNDQGQKMKYILTVPEKITRDEILQQNLISCSSVLVKKSLVMRYPFPGNAMIHEDFAVWLQILREVDYAYGVNEPLLIYRLADHSKSRNKLKAARMNWQTYRFAGVDFNKSIRSMCVYAVRGLKKYYKLAEVDKDEA